MSTPQNPHIPEGYELAKKKKPWYKIWWIWVIIVVVLGSIGSLAGGGEDSSTEASPTTTSAPLADNAFTSCQDVQDAGLTQIDDTHPQWNPALDRDGNGVGCETAPEAEESTVEAVTEEAPLVEAPVVEEVSAEFRSALKKAESYANRQHMSQARLYDQLTSEFGEKFSPEAAQYAVDNVEADWNANALQKARNYQDRQSMSPDRIYDQLTSEFGEQFTPEQAQYAIDNL